MIKYRNNYEGVRKAQKASKDTPLTEADFDLAKLEAGRLQDLAFSILGYLLRWVIFPLSQRFRPVWSLFGITVVTRLEDVQTVLKAHEAFEVPFGLEMEEMTGSPVFALGDDGEVHTRQIAAARQAWNNQRVIEVAQDVVSKVTPALLEDSGGDIDVATDVLMRVMSEACSASFGLRVPNADRFAAYATACSVQLFADPTGNKEVRAQALIGSRRLREILNANIDAYVRSPDSVQERGFLQDLVDVLGPENEGTRDTARAMMFGFITGFLPTVALGAGKMLSHLRANPGLMSRAVNLAKNAEDDPDAFQQFLFEVGRHNPALFPGQMRRRTGKVEYFYPHLAKIPEDNLVFVATGAAIHDVTVMKHPNRFSAEDGFMTEDGSFIPDLSFGLGIHKCFGLDAARRIIPNLLGHVLRQPGIRFSDKRPRNFGPYLGEMRMTFNVEEGQREQAMMNAVIPIRKDADGAALAEYLVGVRKDNQHPIWQALRASKIVHFVSLTAINLGAETSLTADPTHLLVELNVDGTEKSALAQLCASEDGAFADLLEYLEGSSTSFFRRTRARILRPHTWPWGTIGVNFPGTWDSSVKQIREEKELYAAARESLEAIRKDSEKPIGEHEEATQVFEKVRADLCKDPRFEKMFYRPSDRFPAFSRHTESTLNTFLFNYVLPRRRQILFGLYIVLTIVLPVLVAILCGVLLASYTYIALWTIPLFAFVTLSIAFIFFLRKKEMTETPDLRFAPHSHIDAINDGEDLPGHVQNHITSVSLLKPGFFRKITTALSFDIIGKMVVLWFRPGFVTDFATIHYARWVRPKGVEKMIFQSNYDGSWESYLEDFITKVHAGQTMAWNNCVGFPKTNWFAGDGAQDGDAFKRWVRRQQVPLQFWYSQFPDLTTGMIRTNALVRDGLARAETFDEHKAWLFLFASKPRPQHALETSQIQTLLFRGMGRHKSMTARTLRFDDIAQAKVWLSAMVDKAHIADAPGVPEDGCLSFGDSYPNATPSFLAFSSVGIQKLGFPNAPFDGLPTLPHAFVDGMAKRPHVLGDPVSARRKGDPEWRWSDNSVDAVILLYARNEEELARVDETIAKDLEKHKITTVRSLNTDMTVDDGKVFGFKDGISQPVMRGTQAFAKAKASKDDVVDPGEFILGYPDTRGYLQPAVTVARSSGAASCLPSLGGAVEGLMPSFGTEKNNLSDFGRNGSFLVIRQFVHDEDMFKSFVNREAQTIEDQPYQRSQIKSEDDHDLGITEEAKVLLRQAWIGAKLFGRWADGSSLTRNPSMSATTRHRARFYQQVQTALTKRKSSVGRDAGTATEFLARMGKVGKAPEPSQDLHIDRCIWSDGQWQVFFQGFDALERDLTMPLDVERALLAPIQPDNDFRHGTDDPQGLNCPVGAHIRRSNPRDSFNPGSETTLQINNRHRLLRRGRTYATTNLEGAATSRNTDGELEERGSFFMCFNSNLERQFEFVQQTWVDSRFFHGGREGPDPIVTRKQPGDRHVIPGASEGTFLDLHDGRRAQNFVEVVAGGYFFMPSRQALEYLSRL